MKRSVRTTVLTALAVLSLTAAAFAAREGVKALPHGKPSTTPPPWSHGGHGIGHAYGHGDNGHVDRGHEAHGD